MGKIRRQRKKFHLSKDSDDTQRRLNSESWNESSQSGYNNLATTLALLPQSYDNIFAGIKIPINNVSLRDDDAKTSISTSKSVFKTKCVTKEERRKLRHQTFIERINAIQAMKKMKQNRKKSKKCLVNEDTSTSRINATIPLSEECAKPVPTRKGVIVKSGARHKRMLKDIAALKKLWENPEYKADPTVFVSEMVQERLAKENE